MTDLIRILIVDDHFVVREGLTTLLSPRNGMQVIGEATNGHQAIEQARTLQPDVILIDMIMPQMSGLEAIAAIKSENPNARILVLTSFGEQEKVAAAIQAGATGYLLKDSSPDDLFQAIHSVYRGNLWLPQNLAQSLLQPQAAACHLAEQLTARELDVLKLLSRGYSNQEIGQQLLISHNTVRTHVSNLLGKLGFTSRTQAALYGNELGLDQEENSRSKN
jgi:DNA-binding NarL/FixJ family response regulator